MRLPDWQNRLTAYLAQHRATPFAYGQHDCALFVAGAVEAMTGEDCAKGFRGYRTLNGGLKKLAKAGYDTHLDLIADKFERTEKPAPGDIAVVEVDGQKASGIVQGRFVLAAGPGGVGRMDVSDAVSFYGVPI